MKLYLSSLGFPDKQKYQSLFSGGKRVVIFPTACNDAPENQTNYIALRKQELTDMGFTVNVLDISKFGGKKDGLAAELSNYDGAWVLGGNTFYLNYWMRASGFTELLPELLAKAFVYGGESAGAVVAGTSLHGIELLDDPKVAPKTFWDGMSLVSYGIVPHKGNEEYALQYDKACDQMAAHTQIKTLTDDEFIVVA